MQEINLTKKAKEWYAKNYKTLLKGKKLKIPKSERHVRSCVMTESCQHYLSKVIYRVTAIPIRNPNGVFGRNQNPS